VAHVEHSHSVFEDPIKDNVGVLDERHNAHAWSINNMPSALRLVAYLLNDFLRASRGAYFRDPLSEVARDGARRMLAQMLIVEADAFVAMWKDLKLPDGPRSHRASGPWVAAQHPDRGWPCGGPSPDPVPSVRP
jgi:hypothetical protein